MTLGQEYFDAMYADNPDPWGLAERWYEQRKYALTAAALPRPRYRSGIEVGCSVGVLTELLAERCERLLAVDVADAAVAATRARTAPLPEVQVERRTMPEQWPVGQRFDLVVLSEVGYYFEQADLARLLDRVCDALEPGGTLMAVHWRHPVSDYPLPGDAVHAALDAHERLAATVRHEETDFLLTVYARVPPEPQSVAQEAGLA